MVPVPGQEIYGTDPFRSLQSVLEAALALPSPPDLVVATGDLAEDASEPSYARLRGLLLDTGLPTLVIPGNHDSVRRMRSSLVGGPIDMVPVLDLESWRLVLLDSQVRGESIGVLSESELEVLASALSQEPERPVMICLHHSPTRPCPSSGCHLANEEALLRLLCTHPNARVVIAGHSHLEIERRVEHVTLLTTPSSCSQAWHAQLDDAVDHEDFWASHGFDASRHGFRMLTLRSDGRFDSSIHWVAGPHTA
jgi:Icc protein